MFWNSIRRSASLLALCTIASACQTISVVPEDTRLSLLRAKPVDYSRFPQREESDTQEGRGLRNSLQLAEVVGENALIEAPVIEEDLKQRLSDLLPKDYQYKVGEEVLPEYPLNTRFHIYDMLEYDAKALKNGDMVMSNGLLNEVDKEDTLDWIIAHEAAHQLLDHHKSKENREARAQIFSTLGTIAIIAAGDQGNAGNLALGATAGALLLNSAGAAQFEQKEEIQADQLAMDLVLSKETPRNPREGVNQLAKFVEGQELVVADRQTKVENMTQQFIAYCGEAGLFNFSAQLQNPNAQTRTCQNWYAVGRSGVEQHFGLPQEQEKLADFQARADASRQYYDLFIATQPGELPPSVDFLDKQTGQPTGYASFVDKNGPSVRKYAIRQVDVMLAEGRCVEAIQTVRGAIRGPNDADPTIREVAFKAERQCPTQARPYQTRRTCKPVAGHFGPYEQLCISYEANQASGWMLRILQAEFESRMYYEDALEVLNKRRSIAGGDLNAWLPEQIRLLRLSGDLGAMEAQYQYCAELEGYGAGFIEQCDRAAHPEKYETVVPGQGPAVTPAPGGEQAVPPTLLIGFTPSTTFDVFEEALLRTELNDLVRGSGDFIVYMPSDGALRRYLGGEDPRALLDPSRREELRTIVVAHIVRSEEDGARHLNSPHLKAGFERDDDIEELLYQAGGIIHGSATIGNHTIMPVDTVIDPAMRMIP